MRLALPRTATAPLAKIRKAERKKSNAITFPLCEGTLRNDEQQRRNDEIHQRVDDQARPIDEDQQVAACVEWNRDDPLQHDSE